MAIEITTEKIDFVAFFAQVVIFEFSCAAFKYI